MELFFIFGLLFLVVFLVRHRQNVTVKGAIGESRVARWLAGGLDQNIFFVLNNIMIHDAAGGTTQIDHIVLSPYGIFVIETKNMKGWIFGDANSKKWMQTIFHTKNQFQNPFRQNYKHIIMRSHLMGVPEKSFTNIVVFTGNCNFKTGNSFPDALFTHKNSLINFITSFSHVYFSNNELNCIRDLILSREIDNTRKNKKEHISHIKHIIQGNNPGEIPICPRCGEKMVYRQVQSGHRTGAYFWGCSNYPKCRGIVNIRDS